MMVEDLKVAITDEGGLWIAEPEGIDLIDCDSILKIYSMGKLLEALYRVKHPDYEGNPVVCSRVQHRSEGVQAVNDAYKLDD